MPTSFTALPLHPALQQAIADQGYTAPTPIQEALIPLLLEGRDVVGRAQTGTGKTAAFALPLLHQLNVGAGVVQGLVLTPTRELALQVTRALHTYGAHLRARTVTVYGGQPYGPQIKQLRRGTDVVVGTPGRLIDLMERGVLDLGHVQTVVLDEADEMLSMGFVDDIETLL
ncbi:MAG: DEAD/DEAH box helicase, partial [Bacteroidota bacterium]